MTKPKQLKAAIYARCSTNEQDVGMQLSELGEFCRHRNWNVAAKFVDRGISGAEEHSRPQLNRLMTEAHRGKFSVVAVWKFDRFARSVGQLLRALETFRSLGIEFVSLSEAVDTTTPAGKMVFTVLGAVAELERSLIGDRVRAGLRNAKAKGTRLGRPPLRELSTAEIGQLRRERKHGISFQGLARNHGVSVWTAFQLCKKTRG